MRYNAPMSFELSPFFMVLLAIPTVLGCINWLGWKRAMLVVGSLSACAYLIETIGLKTGFPYGVFVYSDLLGSKLFGTTPWTVPCGWVPLLLASWVTIWQWIRPVEFRIFGTVFLLVALDLMLDPMAVALGFWKYAQPGFWFHVPFTNFLGWILSGCIGCLILQSLTKQEANPDKKSRRLMQLGFLQALGVLLLWLTKTAL